VHARHAWSEFLPSERRGHALPLGRAARTLSCTHSVVLVLTLRQDRKACDAVIGCDQPSGRLARVHSARAGRMSVAADACTGTVIASQTQMRASTSGVYSAVLNGPGHVFSEQKQVSVSGPSRGRTHPGVRPDADGEGVVGRALAASPPSSPLAPSLVVLP
jgi:hypothetical protein